MRRRRFFVSVVALLVSIGLPAAALADPYKIVFVTDNTANESAYVTFLQSIYGNDLVIDLTANKYTDTLSASLKAELASANLIIVSRQTNSGNYDFEPQFWNGLDVPMILHNAFLARGGASQPRWRRGSTMPSPICSRRTPRRCSSGKTWRKRAACMV